jgi:PleD family two-component response regulator
MVDVDHFKRINDRFGHETGDQVLRFVAGRLANLSFGSAYRYGGEEFAVLAPGYSCETAAPLFDEIRKLIHGTRFIIRGHDRPRKRPKKLPAGRRRKPRDEIAVSVSIGVAEGAGGDEPRAVLIEADEALYSAKKKGRNRVVARG